jgi:CspA family cold shock protein
MLDLPERNPLAYDAASASKHRRRNEPIDNRSSSKGPQWPGSRASREVRSNGARADDGGGQQQVAVGGIPMAVGRVKWFNDEKGWGFIKQDTGPDVFVHYSQIQGEGRRRLYEDELVEFEIKEGPKGLQAINVMRQNGGAAALG